MESPTPDKPLYCFISYSRRDSAVAGWVQKHLESYKYPAALVKPGLRPPDPVHLRPVFLDTSDLPTSSGKFWDALCAKIDRSRYLLVLCSRASAASEYVDREIARFIGKNDARLDDIILVLVDPQIRLSAPKPEDFPPQIFLRWQYFRQQNHPMILPMAGEPLSVARRRGLMQIISFMLGIEWAVLYNRHLLARRKLMIWVGVIGLIVFTAISVSLGSALYSTREALDRQRELTRFESKVFPFSLVVGYVDNFLSPLITSLENEPARPIIIIALPDSFEDLDQNRRVANYKQQIAAGGYHLELKAVKTTLPRGATTGLVVPTPPFFKDKQMAVYMDFASTVVAFNHVIQYKRTNPAYAQTPEDEMTREYAQEFEDSVKAQLHGRGQDGQIVFVRSPAAVLRILATGN